MAFSRRHPNWIRAPIFPRNKTYWETRALLRRMKISTVCRTARCPNMGSCFSGGKITVLILGKRCTRNCMFCGVIQGSVEAPDIDEPRRITEAIKQLGLRYIVLTSVTRDDLLDGGAGHFAETIKEIRKLSPICKIEVLIPDFMGNLGAVETVIESGPVLLAHNLETVPALYKKIRPGADYGRSLNILSHAKRVASTLPTKSGLMLGLGETRLEVLEVMEDLINTGCDALTLGQYLQPSREHVPVVRYLHPSEFAEYMHEARSIGFKSVASAPLVRSSFKAGDILDEINRETEDNGFLKIT
ncbi:MAG: lipoyl synthase [bacterium]|nr:lipoyl synthase [bacterium]